MKKKLTTPFFAIFILTSLLFAQNDLNDFVEQVTEESVRDWFYRSSDPSWDPLKFHHGNNREEGTTGHDSAKAFIEFTLKNYLGEENVYIDEFSWLDGTENKGYNIIGVKPGLDADNSDIWIVGAHYDSYDMDRTGTAPGANDNGSGIAGVLEMARVINTRESDATIIFALWDAEEPRYSTHSWVSASSFGSSSYGGPSGSRAWVNDHFTTDEASAGGNILLWERVRGNINLDMFGYPDVKNTIWLYHGGSGWNSTIDQSGTSYPESDKVNTLYISAEEHLETYGYDDNMPKNYLTVIGKGKLEYSDHISFSRAGIPGLEYAESSWSNDPHYHKWSDYYRPGSGDNNFNDENPQCEIMSMVIRGALALLADTAGVNVTSDTPTPVELINFTAGSEKDRVRLCWQTASETENLGFVIERRENYTRSWEKIASYIDELNLSGQGTCTEISEYEYSDHDVNLNEQYEYRLSEVDLNGEYRSLKTTSVLYRGDISTLSLPGKAFPNPFNPCVLIDYELFEDAEVSINIFDIKGRLIATLLSERTEKAGCHEIEWNAEALPSGTYLAQVCADYHQHRPSAKIIKLSLKK